MIKSRSLVVVLLSALFCCAVHLSGQNISTHSKALEQALFQAGENRHSLEAALEACKGDTLRSKAVCFLIENMPYHHTGGKIMKVDAVVDSLLLKADEKYYTLVNGATAEMQEADPLHRIIKECATQSANQLKTHQWAEPVVEENVQTDICSMDGSALLRHVDYMCKLWYEMPSLHRMPFHDFLEYVLPYRSITDYPLFVGSDTLGAVYGKYLKPYVDADAVDFSKCYNRTIWWLRHFGGNYPFDTSIGWKEMFFTADFHDCVDKAFYAAQIYRACGWPAAVEFNVAYKLWKGKHYDLSIPVTVDGEWQSYSPETENPAPAGKRFAQCLNIYRFHFALQRDCPFSIAKGKEPIPDNLSDPCIEDVSRSYTEVCRLVLPISEKIPSTHQLVYLASFQPTEGWLPVTWGLVHRKQQTLVFSNVVTGNVYLPVCLDDEGNVVPLGRPFKLLSTKENTATVTCKSKCYEELLVNLLPAEKLPGNVQRTKIEIKRKYPCKPKLVNLSEKMRSAYLLASDDESFPKADTLIVISEKATDEWLDVPVKSAKPYRYYRLYAPNTDPHVRFSEIRFLTSVKHGYKNTESVQRVCSDTIDADWKWLLDDSLDNCRKKPEYDGNVQTAPERRPYVTLNLKEPQWVERIRVLAKNADNHVKAGHWYVLRRWTSSGWENVWQGQATMHKLPALSMVVGGFYWLSDLTEGKEELPFIVEKDGGISFPHDWVLGL